MKKTTPANISTAPKKQAQENSLLSITLSSTVSSEPATSSSSTDVQAVIEVKSEVKNEAVNIKKEEEEEALTQGIAIMKEIVASDAQPAGEATKVEAEVAAEGKDNDKIVQITIKQPEVATVGGNVDLNIAQSKAEHPEVAEKTRTAVPTAGGNGVPIEVCEAYNNFFLMLHNMPHNIDDKNVNMALSQVELLIRTSGLYDSLELIRPQLSNALLTFGREMYKAILVDPPRWLDVSLYLACAPIFREAMVHIVGQYPHFPGSKFKLEDLPSNIQELITTKVNDLNKLRAGINEKLFTSSITIGGQNISIHNLDMYNLDSWIVVQTWRDWFSHSLARCNDKRIVSNTHGTMYRLMAKGGDAYLQHAAVIETLKYLKGPGGTGKGVTKLDNEEIELDLRLMKDSAREVVKPLCVNHSMLDVEEEGIEYLTCTEVATEELPWKKKIGGVLT